MLKLSQNPPLTFASATPLAEWTEPWWVAHTKPRCEKALAWDLLSGGVRYFLPMVERITLSSKKRRKGMAALFPSYVFFCGDIESRQAVFSTGRVCQVIPVREREKFVGELSALQRALANGCELDPYPELVVGKRCRVRWGPLEGIEGTLLAKENTLRLHLQVSMLGQGASLEVAAELLEPLD